MDLNKIAKAFSKPDIFEATSVNFMYPLEAAITAVLRNNPQVSKLLLQGSSGGTNQKQSISTLKQSQPNEQAQVKALIGRGFTLADLSNQNEDPLSFCFRNHTWQLLCEYTRREIETFHANNPDKQVDVKRLYLLWYCRILGWIKLALPQYAIAEITRVNAQALRAAPPTLRLLVARLPSFVGAHFAALDALAALRREFSRPGNTLKQNTGGILEGADNDDVAGLNQRKAQLTRAASLQMLAVAVNSQDARLVKRLLEDCVSQNPEGHDSRPERMAAAAVGLCKQPDRGQHAASDVPAAHNREVCDLASGAGARTAGEVLGRLEEILRASAWRSEAAVMNAATVSDFTSGDAAVGARSRMLTEVLRNSDAFSFAVSALIGGLAGGTK